MGAWQERASKIRQVILQKDDIIWKEFYPNDSREGMAGRTVHNGAVWLAATIGCVLSDPSLPGSLDERLEKVKSILDDEGYYEDIARTIDMEHIVNGARVSIDLDGALASVTLGSELSDALEYGLSDRELTELVTFHKAGKHREKIEDLLTDINFHRECTLLRNGDYDAFWEEYKIMREQERD